MVQLAMFKVSFCTLPPLPSNVGVHALYTCASFTHSAQFLPTLIQESEEPWLILLQSVPRVLHKIVDDVGQWFQNFLNGIAIIS